MVAAAKGEGQALLPHGRAGGASFAVGLVVAAAAFALYLPSLRYEFVFDDLSLLGADGPRALGNGLLPYRPVRFASYLIDHAVGGGAPWAYHLGNLAAHACACLLVVAVALRLGCGRLAAAAGGLLLAVHPLTVESVAYVSGRRDLLPVVFGLAALLAWMRPRPLLAAALILAAVGAKETGIVFVPVLAAASAGGLATRSPRDIACLVATFAIAAVSALAYGAVGPWAPPVSLAGLALPGRAVIHYVADLVNPVGLSTEHPALLSFAAMPDASPLWLVASLVVGLALAIAVCVVGVALVRGSRMGAARASDRFAAAYVVIVAVSVAWWGCMHEPGADRHAYPLLAALAVAAARALEIWAPEPRGRVAFAASACVLVLLAVQTRTQMGIWADELSLWSAAVRDTPHSVRARHNLAAVLAERGDLRKARRQLRAALARDPGYTPARLGRATLHCSAGRPVRARKDLRRALGAGGSVEQVVEIGRACRLPEYRSGRGSSRGSRRWMARWRR